MLTRLFKLSRKPPVNADEKVVVDTEGAVFIDASLLNGAIRIPASIRHELVSDELIPVGAFGSVEKSVLNDRLYKSIEIDVLGRGSNLSFYERFFFMDDEERLIPYKVRVFSQYVVSLVNFQTLGTVFGLATGGLPRVVDDARIRALHQLQIEDSLHTFQERSVISELCDKIQSEKDLGVLGYDALCSQLIQRDLDQIQIAATSDQARSTAANSAAQLMPVRGAAPVGPLVSLKEQPIPFGSAAVLGFGTPYNGVFTNYSAVTGHPQLTDAEEEVMINGCNDDNLRNVACTLNELHAADLDFVGTLSMRSSKAISHLKEGWEIRYYSSPYGLVSEKALKMELLRDRSSINMCIPNITAAIRHHLGAKGIPLRHEYRVRIIKSFAEVVTISVKPTNVLDGPVVCFWLDLALMSIFSAAGSFEGGRYL